MTRQAQWQQTRRARGLCVICGKEKIATGAKSLGVECIAKRRLRCRTAGSFQAWRPGGPGRPPIGVEEF